jgi:hypothetical protein
MFVKRAPAFLVSLSGWIFGVGVLVAAAIAELYRGQNPTAMATVLTLAAAVLTALIAFGGTTYAKVLERKAATEKSHREKKAEFYDKLVGLLLDVIAGEKKGKSVKGHEIVTRGYEFNRGVIIWGSDEVIEKYIAFRTKSSSDGINNAKLIAALFLAMRKDLGHEASSVNEKEILQIFINDIEKVMPP